MQWVPQGQTALTHGTYKAVSPLSEHLSQVGLFYQSQFVKANIHVQKNNLAQNQVESQHGMYWNCIQTV
jgi:hypothetical protein